MVASVVIDPQLIVHYWPFWFHLLLVILSAGYVWIRYVHKKRLQQLSNAFFTSRAVNQLFREESAGYNRFSMLLSAFFLIVFSLFLFEIFHIHEAHFADKFGNEFVFLMMILGSVFLLYQLRIFLIRALGVIFKKEAASGEYIFNIALFSQNLSMFLFPVVVGVAFMRLIPSRVLVYVGLTLIAFVFLYRLYRSLSGNIVSWYYLFLYLCTLEILPVIVLIKAFVGEM